MCKCSTSVCLNTVQALCDIIFKKQYRCCNYSCVNVRLHGTFTQLHYVGAGIPTNPDSVVRHCRAAPKCDGKQLLMQEESSLWLCIDQHSGLIGSNANNREVMDSDWTASAQTWGISLHASHHMQTLHQCLWTQGRFECDWGTQWTWQWRRRPIGSHGSMTHYVGGYKLCFLHLIQHGPLKALIGV